MSNELQVVISVLTAEQPEQINEAYLQRKLDLSPSDFAQQYHSFTRLLKVGSLYCFQALQAELDIVWRLTTDALQKLFYSLTVIHRPENQKRKRYLDLVESRLPLFAHELRTQRLNGVQDHFSQLLIIAQQEGLLKKDISPTATANRLWDLNTSTLLQSVQSSTKTYWLDEVVMKLWPIIAQHCTAEGQARVKTQLSPSY